MKKCACFLLFFIAMPLCAQKNLLPAAKAAWAKSAVQEGVAPQLVRKMQTSVLPLPAARNGASKAWTRDREIAAKILSASRPEEPLRARGKENTFRFDQDAAFLQMLQPGKETLNGAVNPALKTWMEFERTLLDIQLLKQKYVRFNGDESFSRKFLHLNRFSPFSLQNNRLVLKTLKNYIGKMQWLSQYPGQGRQQLAKETGKDVMAQLARRLKDEKLVMLGEYHFIREFQQAVPELLLALKAQNPGRRIVLFTEFLKIPGGNKSAGHTLETYYRRGEAASLPRVEKDDLRSQTYAREAFLSVLKEQLEIYPLEDMDQFNLLTKVSPEAIDAPLASVSRNKAWARVIANKMAQIRQTDPDALFVVYGGMGHTSWLSPAALPKFFAQEKPTVVEFSLSNTLYATALSNVWSQTEAFFANPPAETSFFYWTGKDAKQLSKNTGFDYLLVIPENPIAREERAHEFIIEMP